MFTRDIVVSVAIISCKATRVQTTLGAVVTRFKYEFCCTARLPGVAVVMYFDVSLCRDDSFLVGHGIGAWCMLLSKSVNVKKSLLQMKMLFPHRNVMRGFCKDGSPFAEMNVLKNGEHTFKLWLY